MYVGVCMYLCICIYRIQLYTFDHYPYLRVEGYQIQDNIYKLWFSIIKLLDYITYSMKK